MLSFSHDYTPPKNTFKCVIHTLRITPRSRLINVALALICHYVCAHALPAWCVINCNNDSELMRRRNLEHRETNFIITEMKRAEPKIVLNDLNFVVPRIAKKWGKKSWEEGHVGKGIYCVHFYIHGFLLWCVWCVWVRLHFHPSLELHENWKGWKRWLKCLLKLTNVAP